MCPRSSDQFYIISCYIKWVTTSWTHGSLYIRITPQQLYLFNHLLEQKKRMATTMTFALEMLPDVVLEQVLSFISYDQENIAATFSLQLSVEQFALKRNFLLAS